jgi:hypothetical protein
MKAEFTAFDIINKLGILRGRLREWMNEGFLVPRSQQAEGVGTKALFVVTPCWIAQALTVI